MPKYISRIETDAGQRCWFGRITFDYQTYCNTFSDSKYSGDKSKSLKAAKKWRNRMLRLRRRWKKKVPVQSWGQPAVYARNKSTGVPGVRLIKRDGHYSYECDIKIDGRWHQRRRAVTKHGRLKSFLLMAGMRRRFMLKEYGSLFDVDYYDRSVNRHLKTIQSISHAYNSWTT